MADKASLVSDIFSKIARRYEVFNCVASLGMVASWRRSLARSLESKSGIILDVCTGMGEVIREIHRIAPHLRVIGIDASKEMLQHFRNGDSKAVLSYAEKLPFEEGVFDAATVAFGLRNLLDIDAAISEVGRVLKKGGEFIILEFSKPKAGLPGFLHAIFLRCYLPLAGLLTTGSISPFIYLSRSILNFDDVDKLKMRFYRYGFEAVSVTSFSFGAVCLYKLRKI